MIVPGEGQDPYSGQGGWEEQSATQLHCIVQGKKIKLWRTCVELSVEVSVGGELGEEQSSYVSLNSIITRDVQEMCNTSHHLLLLLVH